LQRRRFDKRSISFCAFATPAWSQRSTRTGQTSRSPGFSGSERFDAGRSDAGPAEESSGTALPKNKGLNMAEELSPTVLKRMELYQDRWSSYGANTGIQEIAETPSAAYLKQIDIFQEYDDAFLEKISQDVSVAVWKKDAVLFEEGAYIDVAFYILQGQVEVF